MMTHTQIRLYSPHCIKQLRKEMRGQQYAKNTTFWWTFAACLSIANGTSSAQGTRWAYKYVHYLKPVQRIQKTKLLVYLDTLDFVDCDDITFKTQSL